MSRIMNIDIDFKVDREKNPNISKNQILTARTIEYVVNLAGEKGLSSDKRRMLSRILDKLDIACEGDSTTVELNEYEFVFLRDCFEKAPIPPSDVRNVTSVENELLNSVQGDSN